MTANDNSRPRAHYRTLFYWTVALCIAGVLFFLSVRGVDWKQVGTVLTHAHPVYLVCALVISSFALFLRAVRWRILLRAGGSVSIGTAFWATAAGYFGNSFLPARAGELIRTVVVSARTGLTKTFVFTTALAERLSDAVTLVIISSVVLLTLSVRPGWFSHAAKPFAIIGLCGATCIAVLPRMEPMWRTFLQRLPIPQSLKYTLIGILQQILTGLRTFHDPARLAQFAGLAMVIWFCDASSTIMGMRALGLTISLPVAFLLITGFGLGSALPSTPGYVGIYQFVAVSVLTPFGFAKSDAIAYSFLTQALQYAFITFWGVLALSRQRDLKLMSITGQRAA